jgi:hypothetical protein
VEAHELAEITIAIDATAATAGERNRFVIG